MFRRDAQITRPRASPWLANKLVPYGVRLRPAR